MTKKPSDLARAELQARCVALRRDGLSYAEIAAKVGAPKTNVFRLVRAALAEYQARTSEDIGEHVALQLVRLDHALAAISEKVSSGSLEAVDRMLKLEARRSRLLGLDAPSKIAPTSPDGVAEYTGAGPGLAAMVMEMKKAKGLKGD